MEVYGNRVTNTGGNLAKIRSGKSFIFFNSMVIGGGNNAYDSLVNCPDAMYDPAGQMIHDTYWWGSRTGYSGALTSASADHTAGLTCNGLSDIPTLGRDVFSDLSTPGVSCGTYYNLPSTCATGQGYWATTQSCADLTGLVGANPVTPINGTLYKCTAPNNWTAFYRLYVYPHPLTVAPFGTDICGEGEITSPCWCEGLKNSSYCCHGYYQTQACGASSSYHLADTNANGCVSLNELISYSTQWRKGSVMFADFVSAVTEWRRGC
jgi:hypothetical protein